MSSLNPFYAFVTTFLQHVCGTELAGWCVPVRVTGRGNDAFGSHLFGREDAQESDGSVANYGNGLAAPTWAALAANAEHIGRRQAATEPCVSERHSQVFRRTPTPWRWTQPL